MRVGMVEGGGAIFGPCTFMKGEVKGGHVNCDRYSCLRMGRCPKRGKQVLGLPSCALT